MGKRVRTIVVMLSLMLIATGIGCVAVSRHATPASIDQKAVWYVSSAGVAEPNDFKGYPNLVKAERLEKGVDSAHDVIQLELEQKIQRDNLEYSIHKDVTANNRLVGEQREEMLFGEKGLLSLGLSLAGFGTLTGFVGLMRKRPGDVTSQEVEQVVSQATGKTAAELSEKEKQLIEVVKGVQKFIDTYKDKEPEAVTSLKELSNKAQDTSTQVAVAKIKKEIA